MSEARSWIVETRETVTRCYTVEAEAIRVCEEKP